MPAEPGHDDEEREEGTDLLGVAGGKTCKAQPTSVSDTAEDCVCGPGDTSGFLAATSPTAGEVRLSAMRSAAG